MKAIIYEEYGPPEVLKLEEVEKPTPKDDEVLVRIHAASVNWPDAASMRGKPFLIRLGGGLLKPRRELLGADLSGRVEAVGKNVDKFQIGDEVFGDIGDHGLGSFSEYAAAPENTLALMSLAQNHNT